MFIKCYKKGENLLNKSEIVSCKIEGGIKMGD